MMPASSRTIDYDRLSVFTGALLLTLAFMRLLVAPARPIVKANILGSPLGFGLSLNDLMLLIVLGLSVTAIASLLHSHPMTRQGLLEYPVMYWILPALLNLALATWLMRISNLGTWAALLLASAVLIPLSLTVEYTTLERGQRTTRWLQLSQKALVHLTALIVFSLIYEARIRSLLGAPAIGLVTLLLAARLYWIHADQLSGAFRYASIAGLILAQITWGLNYWRMNSIQGGLALLLAFYVVVGLIQQFLEGSFDDGQSGRLVLIEYGGVAIVLLLLIAFIAPN